MLGSVIVHVVDGQERQPFFTAARATRCALAVVRDCFEPELPVTFAHASVVFKPIFVHLAPLPCRAHATEATLI
jgi:hypothetical protein